MITVPGKVIGLDLSLRAPGLAVALNGDVACDTLKVPDKVDRQPLRGEARMVLIRDTVRLWASGAELAVIEDAAGRFGAAVDEMAGIRWVVRVALHRMGIPVAAVPPKTLKAYATGNGNADKDAMVAAAMAQWPGVEIGDDNMADACYLAAMGARYLGCPVDTVPAAQVRALEGVAWHDGPRAAKRKKPKASTPDKPHAQPRRRRTA